MESEISWGGYLSDGFSSSAKSDSTKERRHLDLVNRMNIWRFFLKDAFKNSDIIWKYCPGKAERKIKKKYCIKFVLRIGDTYLKAFYWRCFPTRIFSIVSQWKCFSVILFCLSSLYRHVKDQWGGPEGVEKNIWTQICKRLEFYWKQLLAAAKDV